MQVLVITFQKAAKGGAGEPFDHAELPIRIVVGPPVVSTLCASALRPQHLLHDISVTRVYLACYPSLLPVGAARALLALRARRV